MRPTILQISVIKDLGLARVEFQVNFVIFYDKIYDMWKYWTWLNYLLLLLLLLLIAIDIVMAITISYDTWSFDITFICVNAIVNFIMILHFSYLCFLFCFIFVVLNVTDFIILLLFTTFLLNNLFPELFIFLYIFVNVVSSVRSADPYFIEWWVVL